MGARVTNLRKALAGKLSSFTVEYENRKGERVADVHLVSKELFVAEVKKAIRRGVVILKEADGSKTAYERSEFEDKDSKVTKVKCRYPRYGTPEQTRETIKRFPWE